MAFKVPDGTLGSKLRQLSVPGIVLTEATFQPGLALPWHAHERMSFCMLLEGRYTENFRRSSHPLGRFDLTFKPAGEDHRDDYGDQGARCLIVELTPSWVASLESRATLADGPVHLPGGQLIDLATRLYREFRQDDELASLAIEATCLDLLVRVSRVREHRPAAGAPRWLREVKDLLDANCVERLDLATLAATVGVHPVHLGQTFRREFGVTIGEYVRRLRVNLAADRLIASDYPLVNVALGCGFYDQSHFNRTFKRFTGMTPGEFREHHNPGSTTFVN